MKHTILLVDDDADILKVLKANLELHGFLALTAERWSEAEKILSHQTPDLIILDVMLPDGNGIELCRNLGTRYPSMPILMLTARDKVSDKVIGLESGADDYMVKPFETLELIARVKACLRRSQPLSAERVVIGDLAVDFKKRTVSVGGKEITLTQKEYELLCFLISRKGELLSRDVIRRQIWKDSQIYSWSRVIDVHIQHLRQKIEMNPSKPEYIFTVSGAGYRFRE
ncbi:MAG TPA: response regulator transcription factor [Thermodesulfovibrionales bacterium]|nr:response regulator transcription factor [Thermodesulfovibrionales bacterium]